SVWEKPESFAAEELGPVRSSKAARLTHIKKGYYSPPRGPIFVPGLHWLAVILVGRDQQLDPPDLAAMRWWTSRGPLASFKRDEQGKLRAFLLAESLPFCSPAVSHSNGKTVLDANMDGATAFLFSQMNEAGISR
ncbi:MAG TPA: hypothetical protein VKR83_10215, partial [Ktedonobacteraceae bacterium]|nr:hypothetical protein [Ktedonobacteraceae bacterium]